MRRDGVEGGAVLRGAAVGLALIVPVTIVRAVLERDVTDFSTSAWVYPLSALILVAYGLAGGVGGRTARAAPLQNGAAAAAGAVVLWVPVRVLIWVLRETDRGLLAGDRAALPPGQLLGALALAAVVGTVGAAVATRVRRAHPVSPLPPPRG
ncbi:MAG TPA: hypothetical protein VG869_02830 [Acidimicrobiia bacterium]|jgi:hypothetical protein|nr:hypothetical protein [Acidimicrobiia bacterium]